MATIAPTIETIDNTNTKVVTWSSLTTTDSEGDPISLVEWGDRCVQGVLTGTTATLELQGSNDGTNWATLTDVHDTALSIIVDGNLYQVAEVPIYVRPAITGGGDGTTDIDVVLVCSRNNDSRT